MILSCPSCTTRYSVDDSTLGDGGRRVRCAACGHTWHVAPGGGEAKAQAVAEKPAKPETLNPIPKEPAQAYRAKVEARRKRRHFIFGAGAWGTIAAVFVVMLAAAWVFRLDVVRAWPQSSSAYALVGSEANAYGLAIENVAAGRVLVENQPVLEVEGTLRNIDRRDRDMPFVRFALQDADGAEFFAWTVDPEADSLKPGERAAVVTQLVNPPEKAANVALTLADAPIEIADPDVTVETPQDASPDDPAETELAQGGEAH